MKKQGWLSATADELNSFEEKEVKEDWELTALYEKYKKVRIKKLFSKVVATKKPTHDGQGGWKPKIRICVCGNGEEGTYGHADENRAEVPAT